MLLYSAILHLCFFASVYSIPAALLYDHNVPEAIFLPKDNDVSSQEIRLKVPIKFFGDTFETIFVNSNGLLSFQTEIPVFFNIEFPLDYPLIAPFYTNVDTRESGTVSYYETNNPSLLQRATDNVRDYFSGQEQFQATHLFIVTWNNVGFFNRGKDKANTFQAIIINDGFRTFVELLYPKDGIQWIQGTGDESGLPDARAQAGFISADGKIFTLPGSGTEQVRNLEILSNMDLPGQFIFRVDQEEIVEPDIVEEERELAALTCQDAPTYCHVQAKCIDYEDGFCCQCKKQYYGNGRNCVKKDVPLRVNGKINGRINDEKLDNLDLQSYIVMADGRAYTAISKIPESIAFDIQALQIIGSVIGYIFAKPVREALNGYQLTGGVFNHTATLRFLNTSQTVIVKQKYEGLDVFDQLRLEANIQGEIPSLPFGAKVIVDEYQEQYTHTSPGLIQMSSTRSFTYTDENNVEVKHYYDLEQVFLFEQCQFDKSTVGQTWKLKVGRNFISYESREQIIRFGLSNKVTPLGDVDPCEEGRSQCMPNSACVVDNDSFRCVCNPGYQQLYTNNETVCVDIDECQSGLHSCDYNAECHNQVGAYTCVCIPGFIGKYILEGAYCVDRNGQICESANTCANIVCMENSECTENNNVAMCKCLPGFTEHDRKCIASVDQSCHVNNNCDQFAICTIDKNTNKYYCTCLPGYDGDGYKCRRLEITTEPPGSRKEVQRCLLGVCWCPEGYKIEQGTEYCIEGSDNTTEITTITPALSINELPEVQCYNSTLCFCPKGFILNPSTQKCDNSKEDLRETKGATGFNISCNVLNTCDKNARCILNNCQCNQGFLGNGFQCIPGSCTQLHNCNIHASCIYDETYSTSRCVCNEGYDGDGYTCEISAICTSNNDCTATEQCLVTTSQRYECVCKDGYVRDTQNQCILPTTCGGGLCVENAECLYDEEYQLHYCSCRSNFIGDGITECKPKPIGCNVQNECGLHANCEYDQSTSLYQCKCERGFYGDGYVCYTEVNCHVDPSLCDPRATCVTDANRRFICQCNNGYVGNGTICKPNPTHEGGFLLLNQGMATLKIPFEPSKRASGKPIQLKYFQTPVGLDVDCYEGRVYWSDVTGNAIRSSSYNGSDKMDFITKGIGSPEGLAVDWVSRNIYWTDSTKDTIEVASLGTKRRRVLFDKNLVNPRGIAIHPQRGKIFWTDWNRNNPKIEWANADGSGRSVFLQGEEVILPNSLTVDYDTDQLCYADAGTKKIQCIDIDTRASRTIATNCSYPFGIAVTDTHVYWSDWISKKIEVVDKVNLKRLDPLKVPLGGNGNKLYELVAVPQRCPALTNVCQHYKDQCPVDHICLPNGGSRSCVCAYKADSSEIPSCTI